MLIVVGMTVVALILGLLLRNSVETRTRSYTDPTGLSISYPDGWQIKEAEAEGESVQVSNLTGGGFPTTFEVSRVAVEPSAPVTEVLALVGNDLALNWGRDRTAFKVFEVTPNQMVKGLPASRIRYVYVDVPAGILQESLPTVVLGSAYLVRKEGNVYVIGLRAEEDNYDEATARFERFVESAILP
jgi:hypothetical protein